MTVFLCMRKIAEPIPNRMERICFLRFAGRYSKLNVMHMGKCSKSFRIYALKLTFI